MSSPTFFTGIMRAKYVYDGCKTIDEMVDSLVEEINMLRSMRDSGVTLREEVDSDYAFLTTDDPEVARQFGFVGSKEEITG